MRIDLRDYRKLIREINLQIKHHKEEGNTTAIRSLEYIKGIIKE